jgi:hypothetical protein
MPPPPRQPLQPLRLLVLCGLLSATIAAASTPPPSIVADVGASGTDYRLLVYASVLSYASFLSTASAIILAYPPR